MPNFLADVDGSL